MYVSMVATGRPRVSRSYLGVDIQSAKWLDTARKPPMLVVVDGSCHMCSVAPRDP